jgi:hypothetical protein
MKKIIFILMLIGLIVFVSCTQDKTSDTIKIRFGELKAKAIDETAYDVSDSHTETSVVTIGSASDYYWTYSATKADSLFKDGECAETNLSEEKGLGGAKSGFARGKWTFVLKAYASEKERTAKTKHVFEGTTTTEDLTTDTSVSVPMSYTYVAGTGTLAFDITTSISQATLSGVSAYSVSKIEAIVDGTTTELTNSSSKWTGTKSDVSTGVKSVEFKVYVDDTEAATSTVSSIIMHGLTTTISGTFTITLSSGQISVNFGNTAVPTEQPTTDGFSLRVGDIVTMGTYPSGNGNTSLVGQGITWKVLSVDTANKRALVISENVLEERVFNADSQAYSGSDIQTYLNDTFITTYGLSDVSFVNVDVTSSIETTTVGSGIDKVFLLSKTEAENTSYFATSADRVANYNGSSCPWWLRSPLEEDEYCIYFVFSYGVVSDYYCHEYGVRPAFWYSY